MERKKGADRPAEPAAQPKREPIDPAPWLGQVGDGATLESGERIAREIREFIEHRHERTDTSATRTVSADPEMPIPSPKKP
jgi:hypothetical protein